MQIIRTVSEMKACISQFRQPRIGFVPTMGSLHEGHLALINQSRLQDTITVCSIFVNPTQFNDPKDFEKYPINTERDIEQLTAAGCDILFLPSVTEIYPTGYQNKVYDLGLLDEVWEAQHRPGHFQGVCMVMDRLLDLVPAHDLWMGQKDFQQCMVVKKLLALTNRQHISFHQVATVREASGLALSSRNSRLSARGRQEAAALYQALQSIKDQYQTENLALLQDQAKQFLLDNGFEKVEYITVVHAENLLPANAFTPGNKYVAIAAAWMEGVRLIDNLLL